MSDDWYERAHALNIRRMFESYGKEHASLIYEVYGTSRAHEEGNGHETRLYIPMFSARAACDEMQRRNVLPLAQREMAYSSA
ncbi:MAG TPA: hypothetical protein VI968_02485 [archaeon]|nr:hypothetical protein [archaeon]